MKKRYLAFIVKMAITFSPIVATMVFISANQITGSVIWIFLTIGVMFTLAILYWLAGGRDESVRLWYRNESEKKRVVKPKEK